MRASRPAKTVGLDKPCRVCGKPIHYTYSGPADGVCGRCADKRRPRRTRSYHRGTVVSRGEPGRHQSTTTIAVRICIVLVVGVIAVMAVLRLLLG